MESDEFNHIFYVIDKKQECKMKNVEYKKDANIWIFFGLVLLSEKIKMLISNKNNKIILEKKNILTY